MTYAAAKAERVTGRLNKIDKVLVAGTNSTLGHHNIILTALVRDIEVSLSRINLTCDLNIVVRGQEMCGLDQAFRNAAGRLGCGCIAHTKYIGNVFRVGNVSILGVGGRQEGAKVGGVDEVEGRVRVILCKRRGHKAGRDNGPENKVRTHDSSIEQRVKGLDSREKKRVARL